MLVSFNKEITKETENLRCLCGLMFNQKRLRKS